MQLHWNKKQDAINFDKLASGGLKFSKPNIVKNLVESGVFTYHTYPGTYLKILDKKMTNIILVTFSEVDNKTKKKLFAEMADKFKDYM